MTVLIFLPPDAASCYALSFKFDQSGVISWDTLLAQMDDDGTPHPLKGWLAPCGRADHETISECRYP